MESDIAPAVAFMDFDSALGKEFGGGNNIPGFGITAKSDNRGVLQKKENIANVALFAKRHQLFLQAKAGDVIECAELENGNQILGHGFTRINTDSIHKQTTQSS